MDRFDLAILVDRTSTIGIAMLSACLQRSALWLSGSVYMDKSCTSVFLASSYLSRQTFLI